MQRDHVAGGLGAAGFEVIPDNALSQQLLATPALAHCQTETCLQALGNALGARWILTVGVYVIGSASFDLHLAVVDARTAKVADQGDVSNRDRVDTRQEGDL